MSPIICVVSPGRKRGKTRLIEWLIEKLSSERVRIATIKHSMEAIDLRGKDTYRHLEAGAAETCYISSRELVVLRRSSGSIEEAISSLSPDHDLILVEGFKRSPYPKILCAESLEEAREAVKRIENIIAVTGESIPGNGEIDGVRLLDRDGVLKLVRGLVVESWIKGVPNLNCGRCRYGSCGKLIEAIKRGEATIRDCAMRRFLAAKITIDGVEVPLGAWPQQLLRELLRAFIRSLKLRDLRLENARRVVVEVDLGGVEAGESAR